MQRMTVELGEIHATVPLESVYVGGGTPTSLDADHLRRLFAAINRLPLAPDCEVTVECNPGTLIPEKRDALLEAGVNRISLGVQSFSQALRDAIGRFGDPAAVPKAVALLKEVGFSNYNCDLIYGIPEQSFDDLRSDVTRIIDLNPAHVSTYSLIIEPGTQLARRGGIEGEDDLIVDMWHYIGDTLAQELDLQRYEIANHAKPGHHCRHNHEIWLGARFFGVGPSACWFIDQTRYRNPPSLRRWLRSVPPETDALPADQRAAEILATGLRTTAGWTAEQFQARTGTTWQALRPEAVIQLITDGLLLTDDNSIRPTTKGLLFHDHITRELL
jgi:oxygen-independent coproporphyrinogen-3 oxidase